MTSVPDKARESPVALLVMLGAFTVVRGIFAAATELSTDAAYYWVWSTQLDFGYFDHGPVVAWLIRLGTLVLGHTALGVRFFALLSSLLTAWLLYSLIRFISGNDRQAFWITLLLNLAPIFAVGAVVHTPDSALALFWTLSVWFGLRALKSGRTTDWLGLGLATGLAILSKATGLLLLLALGLYLLTCKAGRERIKGTGPALAALLVALLVLPLLIWNSHHLGGSFAFQWRHATAGAALAPLQFVAFLGSQLGTVSPLLWLGLVLFVSIGWQRSLRFGRPDLYFLWCLSGPVLILFVLLGMVHKVEANWPSVAYVAAVPALAWTWLGGKWYLRRPRVWYTIALSLAALSVLLIHLQTLFPILPLDPARDPTARLRGWKQLAAEAVSEADRLGAALAAEGYGPVSELRFYGERDVLYAPSANRLSQYDVWPAAPPPAVVLFLQPKNAEGLPAMCAQARERWTLEKAAPRSPRAGDFRWWVCHADR